MTYTDTTTDSARFQLAGSGPEAYQRYLVPAFFAACADQLLDLAPPRPGERVLDVGCGTGVVTIEAARRLGPGGRVTGVDINEGMLAVARSVAAETLPQAGLDWRLADAGALPFADASFDLACCQQGLQFFPDPPVALGELRRVLAPGGRLALTTWRAIEHHSPFAALARVLDEYAGAGTGAALRAPFAGPSDRELRSLLERAGFSQVRVRIGLITVRFPSVTEFFLHEAQATPAAAAVQAMSDDARTGLLAELTRELAPAADDDGITFPMQTWHATAATA